MGKYWCCLVSSRIYPWPTIILNQNHWFIRWLAIILSDDLSSNVKLLADDILSFFIVHNNKKSTNELKICIWKKISNWSDQWYPSSFRLVNGKICWWRNLIFPIFASGQDILRCLEIYKCETKPVNRYFWPFFIQFLYAHF